MFSDNEGKDEMGDLYLDICVNGVWKNDVFHISKNQGDVWKEQKIDLKNYKGERVIFKFRAITGDGWGSDVCLDDFKIYDASSPITNLNQKFLQSYALNFYRSQIMYRVPEIGNNTKVKIKLYNIQGKVISTLVNKVQKQGVYFVNLKNLKKSLAGGVYLCKMEAKNYTHTIKMVYK